MKKIEKLKEIYNCKHCKKPMLQSGWDTKRWICRDCEYMYYPDEDTNGKRTELDSVES